MGKGDKKRGIKGFKKGHSFFPRKVLNEENEVANEESVPDTVQYMRPTIEEAELLREDPILPSALCQDTCMTEPRTTVKLLRSRVPESRCTPEALHGDTKCGPTYCYKLFHTGKLWYMMNSVYLEHRDRSPACKGDLAFDPDCEEQRGVCWRQRALCNRCQYTSHMFNLYEEIETGKRGRKAATANIGLNVALTQTPVGPTSFRKICLASNIPAPSVTGMQKCATVVGEQIKEANMEDMRNRRNGLKKINQIRGRPEHEIAIQADGMYNNSLYSGVGRNPFQPATEVVYIVAENLTSQHQLISCITPSKICSKHGFHSQDDDKPCDIKNGKCTSTIPMEKNIGDEESWAREALLDLHESGLEVKYITTDPDTAAYRAAFNLYNTKLTKTAPQLKIDTRHLSECHRKFIKSNVCVQNMMPGKTKCYRQFLQNRFSIDLSKRCHAEFNLIYMQEQGEFCRLSSKIHQCINAIKHCYAGDHSRCEIHSRACKGLTNDNWRLQYNFLPKNFKINILNSSNEHTMLECIEYRFGDLTLQQTKLNTNTQKVEATKRSIRRSLPKNVTYSRNFPGRAHSAVFSVNNGPGHSLMRLCSKLRFPIPVGGKVASRLMAEQRRSEKKKEMEKTTSNKAKRMLRRIELYRLDERHQEQKNYKRSQLLIQQRMVRNQNGMRKRKTVKVHTLPNKDHTYMRSQLLRGKKRQAGQCSSVQNPNE